MSKRGANKNHKAAPSVNGTMNCNKGHAWDIRDLNPEREAVNCPVCGDYTSIAKGLSK